MKRPSRCPFPPGARVWGYGRDSGGENQDRSVSDQRQELETYCADNGLHLAGVFTDVARPGSTTAGRDELDALLAAARQSPRIVDGVIVWDFSRLARDYDTAQRIKGELRTLGYVLVSLTDEIPEGSTGRVVEALHDWKNEEDLRRLSVNVKRGLYSLAAQGFVPGGTPPRGFTIERQLIGTRRRKRLGGDVNVARFGRRWVVDPELAPKVREAFSLRARGVGILEIHRQTRIYRSVGCYAGMFRNKAYIGILKYGESEVAGAIEPMVDQATWEAVQQVMDGARTSRQSKAEGHGDPAREPRRLASPYLLSGLVACAVCGSPMHGSAYYSRWHYYRCNLNHRDPKACNGRRVSARTLESAVVSTVLDVILTPVFCQSLAAEVNAGLAALQQNANQEIDQVHQGLAETNRAIGNLLDLVEAFGARSGVKRLLEQEAHKTALQARLDELQALQRKPALTTSPAAIATVIDELRNGLEVGEIGERRRLLRQFVTRVEAGRGNAAILHLTFPLEHLQSGDGKALPRISLAFPHSTAHVIDLAAFQGK